MKNNIFEEIKSQEKRGVLLILTGPTGAGKDTLFASLLKKKKDVIKITTTTSRKLRASESEGNSYFFKTREEFEKMIANDEFFEWVEFRSELYGTQRKTIKEALDSGKDIIWHIDAKGIKNIKQKVKLEYKRSVFIFLTALNVKILENRVHKDEGNNLIHRWNESLVIWEMEQYDDCDYLVINEEGKLQETVLKVEAIIEAKRQEIILNT